MNKQVTNLPKIKIIDNGNYNKTHANNWIDKHLATDTSVSTNLITDGNTNKVLNTQQSQNSNISNNTNKKFQFLTKTISPDPARYNPNYDIINKRTHYVLFQKSEKKLNAFGTTNFNTNRYNSSSDMPTSDELSNVNL